MLCTNCIYFNRSESNNLVSRRKGTNPIPTRVREKRVTISCGLNCLKPGTYVPNEVPEITECNRFRKLEAKLPDLDKTTG